LNKKNSESKNLANRINKETNKINNQYNKGMKLQPNKNKKTYNHQNISKVYPESGLTQKNIYAESKKKSPESKSGDSIPDNIPDSTGYVTNLVKHMFNKIITDEGTLSFLNEKNKENRMSKDKEKLNAIDECSFVKMPVFTNNVDNNKNCNDNSELNLNKTSSMNSNGSINTIGIANVCNKNKNSINNNINISKQNSEDSNLPLDNKNNNNSNKNKFKGQTTNVITNNNEPGMQNKTNNYYINNKNKNNNSNYNNNNNDNKDKESNLSTAVNSDKVIIKGKNFKLLPINQPNQNINNYFERYNLNTNNNNDNNNSNNNYNNINGFKEVGAKENKNEKTNKNLKTSNLSEKPTNISNNDLNHNIEITLKKATYSNNPISNLSIYSAHTEKENQMMKNKSNNKNYTINKNNNDSFTITNERKSLEDICEINNKEKETNHSKTKSFNNETEVKIEKSINHEIIQKKTLMVDNSSQTDLKKLLSEKSNDKEATISKANSSTSLNVINDETSKSKIKEFECQTDLLIEDEDEDFAHKNTKQAGSDIRNNKKAQNNNNNQNNNKDKVNKNKKNTSSAAKVVGLYANDTNNNGKNSHVIFTNNAKIQGIIPGNKSVSKNTVNSSNQVNNNLNCEIFDKNFKTNSSGLIGNSSDLNNIKSSDQKTNLFSNFPSGNSSFNAIVSTNSKNNGNNQEPVIPIAPLSLNDILNPGGISKNHSENFSNYNAHERKEDLNSYPKRIETFCNHNKNTNFGKNSFYNNKNNNINVTGDEEYFEQEPYRDSHINSFHKSKSFKGGYIPYSKRGKNGFYNPNKFNNGLDSNIIANKGFNSRPYYQRGNAFEYNNYNYTFNYGNKNNFEQDDYNNFKKDPQVFNNYYIINSNININGVGNNTLNNISGNNIQNNASNNNNNMKNDININNNNQNVDTENKDASSSINSSNCTANQENILNNINMDNLSKISYNPRSNFINNSSTNIYTSKDDSFNSPSRAVNPAFNQGVNFYPQYLNGMGFVYNNMLNFGMNDFVSSHAQIPIFPNYMYSQANNQGTLAKNLNFENNEIKKNNENQYNKNSLSLSKIYEDIHPYIFHYKLHNDILDYSYSVNEIVEFMKEIKKYIIRDLESRIRKCLGYIISIEKFYMSLIL
jgi:hypothetical protein